MKITATEFKAKCLGLMDEVAKTHEIIIVSKHGKPVAKLLPVVPEEERSWFGYMAGAARITSDIMVSIEGEDWGAALVEESHFLTLITAYRKILNYARQGHLRARSSDDKELLPT